MTVSILGIATCIPDDLAPPSHFDDFARKWARSSAALEKTLVINRRTGIDHRPTLNLATAPLLNRPTPAPIQDICAAFLSSGVALAITASERAIADWGGDKGSITHLICTTCTGSSHPGYDLFLHQALGLGSHVERTLIHGIGCAGGLSIVRLARNIAIASSAQGKRARILCVALEVVSSLLRTELAALDMEDEKPNVASTIFSDASSAKVVGSDMEESEESSFDILDCVAETVQSTERDLRFDIHESGWRAIISPHVPSVTSSAV
ncbi:hypothetical protein P7C73_g6513, partial [Tremellales sp. Uapishka_1]